ncbi:MULTISPECIES: GntR family transcriptional regulator [Micromonospora]|uniref:GntR family transcriptional regulator n=1 Tax=Micromonospora TaxID=1873 RepID=UPI0003EECE70|nr:MULTISPECIES: GntR family transcriptional regulator [unclassified Micromonospora]EWM63129.1 transcriptional regulator, GntR family [Micromonospora sp. M42]MCK1805691.1 GntR family transcriptional regulator [Micromonospora sp. R42106]MCK1831568.1 GntR family transcriptional regulator [Micromonospora sp. R42003]MCK1843044.1 GntR family transcriptional regulator [Micromonospora sp. R42004]MCM1014775.1 GntR family transcriptional regulator [Micromonospora sp. XM-20-01]
MARRETALQAAHGRLRQLIGSEFRSGEKLPNERDLADRLEVSRATVREVLGQLAAEGVVTRTWGIGTFVHDDAERVPVSIGDVTALRDRITATGHRPTLQDASVSRAKCPADCARVLGLEPGSPVWRVDRLFAVDGVPAAWIRDHLPLRFDGRDLDPSGLLSIDLDMFEFLASATGMPVRRAEIELTAVLADDEATERLGVAVGHPLVTATQVGYGTGGAALFHGHITVRTDVLTLRISRGGAPESAPPAG